MVILLITRDIFMDQVTHYSYLSRADYTLRDAPVRERKFPSPEQEDSELPIGLRILSILALSAILWTGLIGTFILVWRCLQHLA